ncbi:MAG: 16S rRNA (adenine(1518)-N(6)/adenine(1519)-N(6))-dimethyltransferase [Pseudonocardia sp.]|nr:16S rRNA (adenine(1518)-N(6)/adenine(1519)-N(6))-dimethyltransferase [Pseudonocardia sp.]
MAVLLGPARHELILAERSASGTSVCTERSAGGTSVCTERSASRRRTGVARDPGGRTDEDGPVNAAPLGQGSGDQAGPESRLLGPAEVREIAGRLGLRPTKKLGQNFVHDPNTVRRIVRTAGIDDTDEVLEVGPGLGSLTLALLPVAARVHAVEIDPVMAGALAGTVAERAPALADRLRITTADALRVTAAQLGVTGSDPTRSDSPGPDFTGPDFTGPDFPGPDLTGGPTAIVANLPYNVAVPVLLHLLAELPGLRSGLVMVQAEVADRMAAPPGSRQYGAPSAKLAWYARARRAGPVPRAVFWPVPGVDSGLLAFTRREAPSDVPRAEVFAVVEAAFAQRRKALRSGLAGWAGSAAAAEQALRTAGIDPMTRAERVDIRGFAAIAATRR